MTTLFRAVKLIVSKMADAVIEAKQGEVFRGRNGDRSTCRAFEAEGAEA